MLPLQRIFWGDKVKEKSCSRLLGKVLVHWHSSPLYARLYSNGKAEDFDILCQHVPDRELSR